MKSESEVAQPCTTLSDPMDCSPPGSSVHGIFQARVLEWVAIAFSTGLHSGSYSVESIGTQVVIEFPAKSLTDDFIPSDDSLWWYAPDLLFPKENI